MRLKVIGSSSEGNGYILEGKSSSLLVEAGYPYSEYVKMHDVESHLAGLVISHEHTDHAGYAMQYHRKGINVYSGKKTLECLGINGNVLEPLKKTSIGSFTVLAFPVRHDAAEPFGFVIQHEECGNVLFVTDTMFVDYQFANINNILIECNYDEEILKANVKDNGMAPEHRKRVVESHMSDRHCIETLKNMDMRFVNNIVLIHNSKNNLDKRKTLEKFNIFWNRYVIMADKGLTVEFNRTPF